MRSSAASLARSVLRRLAAGAAPRTDVAGVGASAQCSAAGHTGAADAVRASSHLWASTSSPAAVGAAWRGAATHSGPEPASPAAAAGAHECDPGCDHAGHAHAHAHGGGSNNAHDAAFEEQERACWSCHDRHKRGSLLCTTCDKLQPVDASLTYFDLMGM
jgi:hypothetical protein